MITLTTSRCNCANQCNCNLITGHITFVPLGQLGPSFLSLIGFGEVEILPVCRHLLVFAVLLAQRRIGIRHIYAQGQEGCHHLLVLGSETTDLTFISCHSRLQVLDLF